MDTVCGISVGPADRTGRFCVCPDVFHEFSAKISDGSEHSTGNNMAFDFAEPDLDLIQPRRVGGCEVKPDLRIRLEETSNCLGLMCRQVIEHNVDLLGPSGMLYQSAEKVDELSTGVTWRGLALHLACFDIQCRVQRQGSVPKILKALPFGASR